MYKKIKFFLGLSLILGCLFLTNFTETDASQAMPRYAINEETKECSEFFMGDECMYCDPPSGWDIIEEFECPNGYAEVEEDSVCELSKTDFCCTAGHSGLNGNCEDLIINEVKQKCAFVEDIDKCNNLPESWEEAVKDSYWGKICPFDYDWLEDEMDCEYKNNSFLLSSESAKKLKGRIMLKVEENGEAYYINPAGTEMFYLGRPEDAFNVMREQGVGTTNDDIGKIEIGLSSLIGQDLDGDGLSDIFEEAIATLPHNPDTDEDGYGDKEEIEKNYDPRSGGGMKLKIDLDFSEKQKGKIFIQVEQNGEAWYTNPEDGKRYFLGRPADAFQVMRNLGLGISNNDFKKLISNNNASTLENEVIISTDKNEYSQGENMKITIENNLDREIYHNNGGDRYWDIQKFENGEWQWLAIGNSFQISNQNSGDSCYIALFEGVEPIALEPKLSTQKEWNQIICPYEPGSPSIAEYIGVGEFRFKFNYGFKVSEQDPYAVSSPQKIIYSITFIIKDAPVYPDDFTLKIDEIPVGFQLREIDDYAIEIGLETNPGIISNKETFLELYDGVDVSVIEEWYLSDYIEKNISQTKELGIHSIKYKTIEDLNREVKKINKTIGILLVKNNILVIVWSDDAYEYSEEVNQIATILKERLELEEI
ncbi:hypothetical protein K8R62_01355 [bacterium]|nr:hypothetical protein [bacterium]